MTARSIRTGNGGRGGLAALDRAAPFAGVLAGRRVDEDDRELGEDREPEPDAVPLDLGFGLELLADRAGEDVRLAMTGQPTA